MVVAAPVHLVGHGYGGAVALQMAISKPTRVLSLTLYEPLPFGVLSGDDPALEEMQDVANSVVSLVAGRRLEDAARVFMGCWSGSSAWTRLDAGQRSALLARIATVPRAFDAHFAARWDQHALAIWAR